MTITPQQLQEANQQHLQWLEAWDQPDALVDGVPVLRAFTYEIIQIFNHIWLRATLGNGEAEA